MSGPYQSNNMNLALELSLNFLQLLLNQKHLLARILGAEVINKMEYLVDRASVMSAHDTNSAKYNYILSSKN